MTAPRRSLGEFGERVAAHRLEARGLRILERNIRVPSGEIDLLAEDGDDLVFVEVRTRRATPGLAAETMTPAKLRRMWQCAMDYCERTATDPARARIDLVAIDLDRRGRVQAVAHFPALEIPD